MKKNNIANKKILTGLLFSAVVLVGLVVCGISPVAAQVTVSIQNATADTGQTVTVPINITGVTNLATADIWLSYNKDVVVVDSVTAGDLGAITVGIDNATGVTKMNWFSTTGVTGDKVFAYVTLKAVGSAGQNSALDLDVKELTDAVGSPITPTVTDGTFGIPTGPPAVVSIQDASATPGQTTTVPVNIAGVTDLATADIWLLYNKDVVVVDSVTNGELGAITVGIDNATGVTKMNWFSTTGVTGTKVFAYVTLKAVGSAGQQSALDLDVKELTDASANPITHEGDDGVFTVATPVALTTITVSPPTETLYVGGTKQFTATAKDQSGNVMTGIIIAWTSSDTTVGTVSQASATTGSAGTATTTFTAKTAGPTTITANNGTVSGTAAVTVSSPTGRRGGGGAYHPSVTTNVPVDSEGKVTATTPLTTDKATLTIPAGIIVKDAAGKPLSTSITMASTPTTAEKIGAIAAYNFGPSGTTFSEPIDLVIEYDPADVPAGAELAIKMYDGTKWVDLPTTVDTVAHTATAKVSHFSIFALFAAAAAPTATPTAAPTAIPTAAAAPTAAPTATPEPPGFEAVFAIAGMLSIAYLVLRKRR